MRKTNDNQEDIRRKIEELRSVLNKVYAKHGNVKDVVKMSQELDKLILIEQKKSLKAGENNDRQL